MDDPILYTPFLDDMREWLGDDVLVPLLDCAPEALRAEMGALRVAWHRADLDEVRETGHRIKGAAGSVACRRLASMAHTFQMLDGLEDSRMLDTLHAAVEDAASAITAYSSGLKSR